MIRRVINRLISVITFDLQLNLTIPLLRGVLSLGIEYFKLESAKNGNYSSFNIHSKSFEQLFYSSGSYIMIISISTACLLTRN